VKSFSLVLTGIILGILVAIVHEISNKSSTHFHRVEYNTLSNGLKSEIDCLAENIYFESANEPTEGKIAVAFVTLNRLENQHFPKTVCDVVKEKNKSVCQFSWYCESRPKSMSANKVLTKRNDAVYNDIVELAIHVYMNKDKIEDPTSGALFYHADYVKPNWKGVNVTEVIGRHIFYRKESIQ
jgi:spore germination cell wall hydrolase CwlJ-like protein